MQAESEHLNENHLNLASYYQLISNRAVLQMRTRQTHANYKLAKCKLYQHLLLLIGSLLQNDYTWELYQQVAFLWC